MAVIVDATGTKLITTVAGASVNYTGITVGTGVDRALVVTVACAAAVTAPNAHWDTAGANQAMTLITAVETQTNVTTFMFGLRNPVAGAKTLNVAWTTSAASNVEAISFTDVDQTSDAKAFINANFVKDGGTAASILMALTSPAGSIAVASYGTSATFSSLTGTNLFTDTTNTGCEGAASRSNGAGANITFTGADTTTTGNKVMVGFVVAPVITVISQPLPEPVRPKIAGALAIAIMASGLFSAPLPPKEDVAKVDRWYSAWQDPVWSKKGLAAHEQQFLAWSPGLTKEDTPKQEWTVLWEQPLRAKPGLGVQHQPSLAWDPQPITTTPATVILLNSEVIFQKKVIYPALAEPVNFTTATTPTGWNDPLEQPVRNWARSPIYVAPFLAFVPPPQVWFPPNVTPDIAPKRAKPAADFIPWTFLLEPAPQVFFPYAPWDDFARGNKKPPLDTQPLAWSTFTPAPVQVTYFPTAWPDFATKKQPPLNYNPLTFVANPQQVFFPYAPWDDFARRKPQPIDTQPLAWPPTPVVTPFPAMGWNNWPDFAPRARRVADFIPWTFIPSPVQVFFTQWAPWPDQVPTRKKPVVDFRPWTFLEPPPQVFFPYGPWDDFARKKPQPLDTQPLDWSTFTPAPVVSPDIVAGEDGSSGPVFKWRLIYRVKTEPVFVPPIVMAWVQWPDFARRKPPPLDTQPLAWSTFTPVQVVTYFTTAWPDFAPRAKRASDFTPWTFIPTPAQVFFPYGPWDDFARRKPQPLDTQPLAWSTFTPVQVATYFTTAWPDFAPGRKRTVEYPYLAFVAPQPPWNAWTIWPDLVPTRKRPADFVPTFIPTPAQVFFPYAPWDDFARRKQPPLDTQPLAEPFSFTVEVTLVSKWFEALSMPPGPKRGLGTHLQSSYTNDTIGAAIKLFARTPWYVPLSEPVRIKPGIRAWLQKFIERDIFVANFYLASLNATEQGDFLTAVLAQFNTPISAYVDIVQNDPRQRGNLGVIENVAQSSIIASIAEPQTVPATGQPVSTVAGARVAIIVT